MRKYYILFAFLLLTKTSSVYSQSREIIIKTTSQQIIIDGLGNDIAWNDANEIDDFFQYFPSDLAMAEFKTSVKRYELK